MAKQYYRSIADLPREELFARGHRMCQGCAAALIMRWLTKAIGKDAIIVNATGCVEVTTTVYPYTAWKHPWIHVAFENAAAVASGVETAIKMLKKKGRIPKDKDIKVVVVAGDGGTYDIGLQALSGMLERYHDVMYVLYDNEAYMNTGIQRSGGTPLYAWTTTTPAGTVWRGERRPKKPITDIVAAHRIPYVATANPAYIVDMMNKFKKGLEIEGPTFIHVFSPCTPGWRIDTAKTIEVSRLAVLTAVWVNYEIENGEFRVTSPVPRRKHVKHYLKLQGRFRHMTEQEIEEFQKYIDKEVERINKLAGKEVIGPVVE